VIVTSASAKVFLLSAIATCPSLEADTEVMLPAAGCPQVHTVRQCADPGAALNLVFLGEGFIETELPTYACAVRLLVETLLEYEPFSTHACRINAYRLDIASEKNEISTDDCGAGSGCNPVPVSWNPLLKASQCPELAYQVREAFLSRWRESETRYEVSPEIAARVPPQPFSCLTSTLEVGHCRNAKKTCGILGTSAAGIERAWRLASCAPNPGAVILVANSGMGAAGWKRDGGRAVAIVPLLKIGDSEQRSRYLAHELAHSLGLFDEYDSGYNNVAYQPRRNIWRKDHPGEPVPRWNALCPDPGDPFTEHRCKFRCNKDDCTCTVVSDPPIGRWQGAFTESCEYYRSQSGCHMNQEPRPPNVPGKWPYFCPACKGALHDFFLGAMLPPCETPSISATHILLGEVSRGIRIHSPAGTLFPRAAFTSTLASGSTPSMEALFWPAGRFRAVAELEGTAVEVDVEEVEATLVASAPGSATHQLRIHWLPGPIYDRLEWSLDGQVLTPELLALFGPGQLISLVEDYRAANIRAKVRYQEEEIAATLVEIILWDAPDYTEAFLEPVYAIPLDGDPVP
jgi:hypothetical protein